MRELDLTVKLEQKQDIKGILICCLLGITRPFNLHAYCLYYVILNEQRELIFTSIYTEDHIHT